MPCLDECRQLSVFIFLVGGLGAYSACGDDGNGASADAAGAVDAAAAADGTNSPDASTSDAGPDDAAPGDDAGPDSDAAVGDAGVISGVLLNEVLLDELGSDLNEFAELRGEPSTDYSGLSLLQIDGDNASGTNPGEILTIHVGCTTDAQGYCEIDVNANQFQNGTQTLLLVSGSGLTTGLDIDADDDGVIDNEPWTQLIDAVAIFDDAPSAGNIDRTYAGSAVLTKVESGDEPAAFGGASRIPDGTDTDAASDWTSNTPSFDNAGVQSGEANNTPGAANTVAP